MTAVLEQGASHARRSDPPAVWRRALLAWRKMMLGIKARSEKT